MRFLFPLFIAVLFNVSSLFSQETQNYGPYWELLFQNQRQEALAQFQKNKKDRISDQIIREIIKAENGKFANPDDFIEKISAHPDFEYYLYALWNQSFFFDTYLNTGFNNKNSKNINAIDLAAVKNPTVKQSLRYLKSAVAQRNDDWETFYRLNSEIPAIKDWEFCGSFENLNGSGLDTEYGPEKNAVSATDFNANSNGYLNWYAVEGRNKEAYQYYTNHAEYGSGVNYAQTFFTNPQARKAAIRFGSSALAKVWLNDVLVYENTNDGITDMDAYNVTVDLPKGNNRLLVKSADQSGIAYFIVRMTDEGGNALKDLQFDTSNKTYVKSTVETLNPKALNHPVEAYFAHLTKKNPNNFFYTFCLLQTYLRNSKYTEAKAILLPLLEKYPNSSFLRKHLIQSYTKEKDHASAKELQENIEKDDETYYMSYIYRFQDSRELFKMPIGEFEKFIKEFSAATDMPIMKASAELFLNVRNEDKTAVKRTLESIVADHGDQLALIKAYLNIYARYLNENDRAIEVLEDINADHFDYVALKLLARFYDQQDKKNKALALFEKKYELVQTDNIFLKDYIHYLHGYKKYKESLPHLDKLLTNYPYSFVGMELKGEALEQLGKKEEALVWYKKSLKHNGANSSLRDKIDDLSNAKDYFEDVATKDIHKFISDHRNKDIKNNYGQTYLLDESLLQLYPEGGGKSRKRYVVEVTSDSGIESLKEINLGLGGNYHVTKSEIVKQDQKVVPASKSGSNLVFNNLEIGDVIHIDYESSYSNTGRFYKDHVDYFQFESYHPIIKNTLKVLVPKGKKFEHRAVNGDIDHTEETMDDYVYHTWQSTDAKPLEPQENYMPSLSDISKYIHLGTIASWDDIANWYSDLVRPQIIINSDVEQAFENIFPKGADTLGEDEKASRIYYYIMENFSYSHVGFRQSGYVPQKPSKTIKSKLGDCKDFSALYVTLARMAKLESHMVLILTSDYGERPLVLPSQDFNHCIAKVFIDGKPQYLELTDNNMPYKAIPNSLENATALDIPNKWVKNVQQGIYKLQNIEHRPTVVENSMVYTLGDTDHKLQIESVLRGSVNSNYASVFKESNYDVIKKSITEDFQGRISEDFVLDSIHSIDYALRSPVIKYVTDLTVNEKMNEIGSLRVFTVPTVNNPYNTSIIEDDMRHFPIDYLLYENVDVYKSDYVIKLNRGEQFMEVPKNRTFEFKEHYFQIGYELVQQNELHVKMEAQTPKDRIAPEEYKAFKTYVKSVLDAQKQLIGFRRGEQNSSANIGAGKK